jgi:AraC-like DNA-binding protein
VRVTKSILFSFYGELTPLTVNIGFAAQALLAPLLLLYSQSLDKNFKLVQAHFFHFIPTIIILIFSNFLSLENFWYEGGYTGLLYLTLVYLVAAWYQFYRISEPDTVKQPRFLRLTLVAFSAFQLSYFTNYILMLTPYLTGPIINTVSVYGISFIVLTRSHILALSDQKKKYKNLSITKTQAEEYGKVVKTVLEKTKPFLEADFSLKKLSILTDIPEHILSFVFSEAFNKNFVQIITQYRIEEAKKLLKDPAKDHYSIAGICSECGFNSLSVFNSAFKKITKQTPSEFKKVV